jgi:hypothetical protein
MPTQQPQFRDKRLPESKVWTDINDLRWNFLFGGLFVPERPIDPLSQPTMGGDEPDFDPTPDTTQRQDGSQNIDEAGDTAGQGNYNPDLDGEDPEDGEADTDSKPDHQAGEGDEPSQEDNPEDPSDNNRSGDSGEDSGEEEEEDFDSELEDAFDEWEAEAEANDNEVDPEDFDYTPTNTKPELPGLDYDPVTDTTTRTFESWMDFIYCASDLGLRGWTHGAISNEHEEANGSYYATETLDQAIDMAIWSGWPEGRDLLIDTMAQVVPTNEYRVHHELDVAGSFPIVPIYCAGDPSCMMSIETETLRQHRPIVRIDYNNVCSFAIKPASMMMMGAAVLSFAQTLENAGYSVELRIIGNMRDKKNKFRYNVVYKRAGEPLDLDRAAFAIAHPSTMRRFALGLLEQHLDLNHFGSAGHGYPMREANDPTSGKPGGAIFIPPASRNYTTISECKTIVENAAADLISQLTKVRDAAD